MTFWADNIKFIKDVLDSKYKKIEDNLVASQLKEPMFTIEKVHREEEYQTIMAEINLNGLMVKDYSIETDLVTSE